jgi:alpha-beta hydrolase superfamily lysophospholipase
MSEQAIAFSSQGFQISGVLHTPDHFKPDGKSPAIIVLHGFGSNKSAENVRGPCAELLALGYVTLSFDMPGCGDSEGPRGHLICLEQVECTRDALSFLQTQPGIKSHAIGVMGSSFGAAVAVYAGSVDARFAAVISSGGWGHGERKFKGQHPTPEAWSAFTQMLADGQAHRAQTGQPLMVPREQIVPIPMGLKRQIVAGSIQQFTSDTAQSMFDFRAEEVVHLISPRPLLLLHSSVDSVTPTEQSLALFACAGMPKELHLFADTDHFMFAEGNRRVWQVVGEWLNKYLPVGFV